MNHIQKLRGLVYPDRSVSSNLKNLGKLLGWGGLITGLSVAGLGLLGFSVNPIVLPALVFLGVSGSLLEWGSHQYALRVESRTSLSKRVYELEHSTEMLFDTGFLVWDVLTLGSGSVVSEALELTSKEFAEDSVELTIRELTEEFTGEAVSESGIKWIKNAVRNSVLFEKFIKNGLRQGEEFFHLDELSDELISKLKQLGIYDKISGVITMPKTSVDVKNGDYGVLEVGSKWILFINEELFNNVDDISEYAVHHELAEIITYSAHPIEEKIMKEINENIILSQLSQESKEELKNVIYHRLIADNYLIKNDMHSIDEMINIRGVLDEIDSAVVSDNLYKQVEELINLCYYETITGKNVYNDLFYKNELLSIYEAIKEFMEGFL